jgi:hypothetical protein
MTEYFWSIAPLIGANGGNAPSRAGTTEKAFD